MVKTILYPLLGCFMCLNVWAQKDIEKYIHLIDKAEKTMVWEEYLGEDYISGNRIYKTSGKGIVIFTDRSGITDSVRVKTIEFSFRGYQIDPYTGKPPFGLKKDMSWKKCHMTLKNQPQILELTVHDFSGGKYLEWVTNENGVEVRHRVSYPGGSKHKPSKTMFTYTLKKNEKK